MKDSDRKVEKAGMRAGVDEFPVRAQSVEIAVEELIDPELRSAARSLSEQYAPIVAVTDETIGAVRGFIEGHLHLSREDASPPVAVFQVPGIAGNPEVRVFVINAQAGANRAGILHTHAGGYMFANARGGIRELQRFAAALDCVIATVDYRLAPEARYYESLEDNYAALRWFYGNAALLGLDQTRIALMGESAGGGHAALLAITARDRGEIPIRYQMLVYPLLDDRTGTSRPVPAHLGTHLWTTHSNRVGWRSFLGCEPGSADVPACAVPARVADVSGLPPAFIGVGALDLLVEENIEYARRLIAAGVQTELQVVPGAFHGFDIAEETSVAKRFRASRIAALARAFGSGGVICGSEVG